MFATICSFSVSPALCAPGTGEASDRDGDPGAVNEASQEGVVPKSAQQPVAQQPVAQQPVAQQPAAQQPPVQEASPATTAKVLKEQNEKFQQLESFARVLNLLESAYVEEASVSSSVLVEKAIKGMVSALDPHTTYLPASQLKDLTSDTSGKFGGIGIVLSSQEGKLEVVEVIANSPAARAGMVAGDVIHSVEGLLVNSKNIEEILNKMRGLPGSNLTLELRKYPPAPKGKAALRSHVIRKVTITREIIKTESVTAQKLSNGYAYLKISVFQEETADQTDKALRKFEAENGGKLDGLVLDLRGNPGGLLDQAVRVADLFLDAGIIVSTVGRDKAKQEVEYASKRSTHPFMPLVVIVNEGSASASEIVAGALQDQSRALIVGATTFGKGSVQSIVQLPNGAGLKMTIARYYTPKGRTIQAKGIVPDIPIAAAPVGKRAASKEDANESPEVKSETENSKKQESSAARMRKEADLEGHIEASDLAGPEVKGGFADELEAWPEQYRNDNQLRAAYTYLRSWSKFSALGKISNVLDNKSNNKADNKADNKSNNKANKSKESMPNNLDAKSSSDAHPSSEGVAAQLF